MRMRSINLSVNRMPGGIHKAPALVLPDESVFELADRFPDFNADFYF